MINENKYNFEDIRPYTDQEVPAIVQSIVEDSLFPIVANYLYPNEDIEFLKQLLLSTKSVEEFQLKVMHKAIRTIIDKSSSGITFDGFDKMDNNPHILLANHRDIMLDSAILDVLLVEHNKPTCQITFGSNLMRGDLVIHIGKINKMFRIMRGGNIKDFYKNSLEVSAYMRHVITEKKESVWIAQRNGRTKDGADKTEIGVLKMFCMSSDKPFLENMNELNFAPVCISYEYEPCDFLKTAELYISRYQKYEKSENEDLNSILQGIQQHKGHIHICMTPPITREELIICDQYEKNNKLVRLAEIIDKRIYNGYKLYPNNYIAYDLLSGGDTYANFYTKEEKQNFMEYMTDGIKSLAINADINELIQIFLSIYANPIKMKQLHE
ncbi:MAG: acyltransferase [Paludibacteraceae bacterium]|nr:acyltransferase [Paludibacteraceae bacterium]